MSLIQFTDSEVNKILENIKKPPPLSIHDWVKQNPVMNINLLYTYKYPSITKNLILNTLAVLPAELTKPKVHETALCLRKLGVNLIS